MEFSNPVLVVALVLGGVLLVNIVILRLVRRDKPFDFGYYRLISRTLKNAGNPLKRQNEDLEELNRLVRQIQSGTPPETSPEDTPPD